MNTATQEGTSSDLLRKAKGFACYTRRSWFVMIPVRKALRPSKVYLRVLFIGAKTIKKNWII